MAKWRTSCDAGEIMAVLDSSGTLGRAEWSRLDLPLVRCRALNAAAACLTADQHVPGFRKD